MVNPWAGMRGLDSSVVAITAQGSTKGKQVEFRAKPNADGFYVLFPKGSNLAKDQILATNLDVVKKLLDAGFYLRMTAKDGTTASRARGIKYHY